MTKILVYFGIAYYLFLGLRYWLSVKVHGHDKEIIKGKINKDAIFYRTD
jgi:threonine/homoserine/homoserine lactone efflux protein